MTLAHVVVLTGDPRLPDVSKRNHRYNEEDFATHRGMQEALQSLPGYRFEFLDDHERLFERFTERSPDLVLNFCDTGFRNIATRELHVPALLEMLDVPYTGATPACMALAYDKEMVRLVAAAHDVPVPKEYYIERDRPLDELPDFYPCLIKPNQADGSLGISKDARVTNREEAIRYMRWLRQTLPGKAALMQEYLPGREYGVGLIGNPETDLEALPVLEVDFSALPAGLTPILSYESKAIPGSPYWTDISFRQSSAPPEVTEPMVATCKRLFRRLGFRDYGRFDFRAGADGVPRLMEVNPNPAWSYDGKLAMMAGFAGMSYAETLNKILKAAVQRIGLS